MKPPKRSVKSFQNPVHYRKYSQVRKELKNVVKTKMQSNLFDDSNPRTLTKKFWSYVKSSSTSSRIPEQVHHNSIHANKSHDKANLFNTFFLTNFHRQANTTSTLISENTNIIILDLMHRLFLTY